MTAVFDPHSLEEAIAEVDICFVIDATSSMIGYIAEARRLASAEAERVAAGNLNIRYALVGYRDHPPQDTSWVTQIFDFGTRHAFDLALANLSAEGGGDAPEAVYDGLAAAGNLQWRPTADHLCFLIGDCPPHGVGYSVDGFPDGCPCRMTAGGIIELFDYRNIRLDAVSIAGIKETAIAFRDLAHGCRGECVEVASVAAAVGATTSSVAATAATVNASSAYAVAMSSTPGMTDAAFAVYTGTPLPAVKAMRGYLDRRGIKVPDVGPKK